MYLVPLYLLQFLPFFVKSGEIWLIDSKLANLQLFTTHLCSGSVWIRFLIWNLLSWVHQFFCVPLYFNFLPFSVKSGEISCVFSGDCAQKNGCWIKTINLSLSREVLPTHFDQKKMFYLYRKFTIYNSSLLRVNLD